MADIRAASDVPESNLDAMGDTTAPGSGSPGAELRSSDDSDSRPRNSHRKYGLRNKTTPPSRLMLICSRTSSFRGGRDVKLHAI